MISIEISFTLSVHSKTNKFSFFGAQMIISLSLWGLSDMFSSVIPFTLYSTISESNIATFLNEVANLLMVILATIIAVTIMFFVTIAILTSISAVAT